VTSGLRGGVDDSIDAGYGNDLVYGQDGNDTIVGGLGSDELQGQGGDDIIVGSAYSDLIFDGDGIDFINGGFGHDRGNGGLMCFQREPNSGGEEGRNLFLSQYDAQLKKLTKYSENYSAILEDINLIITSQVERVIEKHEVLNNIDLVVRNAHCSNPSTDITQVILSDMIRLNGG